MLLNPTPCALQPFYLSRRHMLACIYGGWRCFVYCYKTTYKVLPLVVNHVCTTWCKLSHTQYTTTIHDNRPHTIYPQHTLVYQGNNRLHYLTNQDAGTIVNFAVKHISVVIGQHPSHLHVIIINTVRYGILLYIPYSMLFRTD